MIYKLCFAASDDHGTERVVNDRCPESLDSDEENERASSKVEDVTSMVPSLLKVHDQPGAHTLKAKREREYNPNRLVDKAHIIQNDWILKVVSLHGILAISSYISKSSML